MKNIIVLIFGFISINFHSQIIIGDHIGTAENKSSVLLEFAKNSDTEKNNKGLIVPYVQNLPQPLNATPGTILLHASENGAKSRVKYFDGVNWVDLSGRDSDISSTLEIQKGKIEESHSKVIIGNNTTSANGALVLESNTKAIVLPIVSDVSNIPSPSPGMIVYVKKEGAKRLAVFNGTIWTFWKP